MVDFSVFLAAIRPQNWLSLYNSIKASTSKSFELIFVGPYEFPENLKDIPNIKHVKDYGSPTRCYQLGLLSCTSPYVVWTADDGVFLNNGAIDKAFAELESSLASEKKIVLCRYYEGLKRKNKFGHCDHISYWQVSTHFSNLPLIPQNFLMVMTSLMSREYLLELGGWDCEFDHLGLGANDLSVRMQRDGANIIMGDYFMQFGWTPGTDDHLPIHNSHYEHEEPLFKRIYSDPNCVNRIRIDVNNWNKAPSVWTRRFGTEIKGIDHPELLR